MSRKIYVYADWVWVEEPRLVERAPRPESLMKMNSYGSRNFLADPILETSPLGRWWQTGLRYKAA